MGMFFLTQNNSGKVEDEDVCLVQPSYGALASLKIVSILTFVLVLADILYLLV